MYLTIDCRLKMCNSKAYFQHDLTIPERKWYVGDRALYSSNKSKRLPLVFIAPIYVPFENQLVEITEETKFLKNKHCAKFLFPINWREGGRFCWWHYGKK